MRALPCSARRAAGFTLLELMIVVVIIGVLAGVAIASYQHAIVKSRRNTAATCLQQRAQLMERYYTSHMSYAGAPAPAQCEDVTNFYTIAFKDEPAANSFGLTATPLGAQLRADTECGVLGIDQTGERTVSGTVNDPGACW